MPNDPIGATGEAMPAKPILAAIAEVQPGLSPSLIANALLSAFVTIETEQARLDDGTTAGDLAADALAPRALAMAEALRAVPDYAGNVDLAAARILTELRFEHPFNRPEAIRLAYDDSQTLHVLSALAGATTGTVRQQATFILGLVGKTVAPEAAGDPLRTLIEQFRYQEAAFYAIEAASNGGDTQEACDRWEALTYGPHYDRLRTDPPAARTVDGIAAARDLIASETAKGNDWLGRDFMTKASAGFIDTGPHDPARALVNEYRTQYAVYLASPEYVTQNETTGGDRAAISRAADAVAARTYEPTRSLIEAGGIIATSAAGAASCLEVVVDEYGNGVFPLDAFAVSLLNGALHFLSTAAQSDVGSAAR